jgi:hypothetical protein
MSLGWNALIGKNRDRHFLERQNILKWVGRGVGEWFLQYRRPSGRIEGHPYRIAAAVTP